MHFLLGRRAVSILLSQRGGSNREASATRRQTTTAAAKSSSCRCCRCRLLLLLLRVEVIARWVTAQQCLSHTCIPDSVVLKSSASLALEMVIGWECVQLCRRSLATGRVDRRNEIMPTYRTTTIRHLGMNAIL